MLSKAAPSISGPTSVSGSRGSPIFTAPKSRLSRATSASATLSWTISRRSVVQRWPAVPTAANRIARSARSRSAEGQTIVALLPPSSSSERPKRCATRGPTARPIARRAGGGDQRHARIVDQRLADVAAAVDRAGPGRPAHRRSARSARSTSAMHGQRESGVFSRRLPDDRIAADQRQRRIPGPDRDGEVEGADHAAPAPSGCHCSIIRCSGRSLAIVRP